MCTSAMAVDHVTDVETDVELMCTSAMAGS